MRVWGMVSWDCRRGRGGGRGGKGEGTTFALVLCQFAVVPSFNGISRSVSAYPSRVPLRSHTKGDWYRWYAWRGHDSRGGMNQDVGARGCRRKESVPEAAAGMPATCPVATAQMLPRETGVCGLRMAGEGERGFFVFSPPPGKRRYQYRFLEVFACCHTAKRVACRCHLPVSSSWAILEPACGEGTLMMCEGLKGEVSAPDHLECKGRMAPQRPTLPLKAPSCRTPMQGCPLPARRRGTLTKDFGAGDIDPWQA